jgi:hypothetical protein
VVTSPATEEIKLLSKLEVLDAVESRELVALLTTLLSTLPSTSDVVDEVLLLDVDVVVDEVAAWVTPESRLDRMLCALPLCTKARDRIMPVRIIFFITAFVLMFVYMFEFNFCLYEMFPYIIYE